MASLLAVEISLEDVFARFCDLLASFIEATAIEVTLRDRSEWVRLTFDASGTRRESGVTIPHDDPTVATVAFGRTQLEREPARFMMPLAVGKDIVGAVHARSDALAAYTEGDAAVIESLAPYMAVAIRQRWLQESVAHERFRAEHDSLTKLANRTLFGERLDHALTRSKRSGDRVAVIYLDLDGFKAINDAYGHEAGDAILRAAARRLRRVTREVDTVARMGGDEFAVLLEDVHEPEVVADVAKKLERSVATPITWNAQQLRVGVSVGIAMAPDDGTDARRLVKSADTRMYREKRARKLRIV
jgi:diguanylate cyclase (GGDEF)-like protein